MFGRQIALEDYTMVLSASIKTGPVKNATAAVAGAGTAAGAGGGSVAAPAQHAQAASASASVDGKSMTGFVFETISEMTIPTVDHVSVILVVRVN